MVKADEARIQWLEQRRAGIGGSEAAAVLGLSPWKSALELYCDKLGINPTEYQEPDWLYWGKALEPIIADRFKKDTGRVVVNDGEFHVQRSEEYPWMLCTIDRTILRDDTNEPGILSIKNVAGFKKAQWADEPPVEYQVQIQHEFVVTGRRWGSFAVLFNGHDFGWYDVERNDRFCEHLIKQERLFWQRVLTQEPPEPGDPADSTAEALRRLYPGENGETIALPGELIEEAEHLANLKHSVKVCAAEIEKIENKFRAAIGDATFGVLPSGVKFSLKTTKRAGYTVEPTEYRALRRLK